LDSGRVGHRNILSYLKNRAKCPLRPPPAFFFWGKLCSAERGVALRCILRCPVASACLACSALLLSETRSYSSRCGRLLLPDAGRRSHWLSYWSCTIPSFALLFPMAQRATNCLALLNSTLSAKSVLSRCAARQFLPFSHQVLAWPHPQHPQAIGSRSKSTKSTRCSSTFHRYSVW